MSCVRIYQIINQRYLTIPATIPVGDFVYVFRVLDTGPMEDNFKDLSIATYIIESVKKNLTRRPFNAESPELNFFFTIQVGTNRQTLLFSYSQFQTIDEINCYS